MKRAFALSAVCTLLAACGGGGGSGSSSSYQSVDDYDYINLNSENATEMVSSALEASTDIEIDETLDFDEANTGGASLLALAQSLATEYTDNALVQPRASSVKENCSGGGSMSASKTGSQETIQSGDTISISFNNCVEGGTVTNGGFDVRVDSFEDENIDISANFKQFSLTEDSFTSTLNGDLSMAMASIDQQSTFTLTVNQLNMSSTEAGKFVLADLRIQQVENDSAQSSTLSIAYELGSDYLDGRVKVETPQILSFSEFNSNPDTGVLRVVGAGNSSVTLDADTGNIATALLTVFDGSSTTSDEVNWSSIGDVSDF